MTSLQRSATSVRPAEMAHGALARSAAEMCVALRLLIQNKDKVYKAVSGIFFLKPLPCDRGRTETSNTSFTLVPSTTSYGTLSSMGSR